MNRRSLLKQVSLATAGLIISTSEAMSKRSETEPEIARNEADADMEKRIIAKLHATDFDMSDSAYNSLNVIGNDVYYTLCTHNNDFPGRVYRYNSLTGDNVLIADLGVITGEAAGKDGKKFIPHGKSHSPFYQMGDKIYFATHLSYMVAGEDGRELSPTAVPEGYLPYTGGKFFEYTPATGQFKMLFSLPMGEGILTMHVDEKRALTYCFSWPTGVFWVYDIKADKLYNKGMHHRGGEAGVGEQFSCVTRHIAIDPRDGAAYFSNSDGDIMEYRHETGEVTTVNWAHLRKDVFGKWDPRAGGHDGYNWRYMVWNEKRNIFYGVHGKSGYLFSFDPKEKKVEIITRIVSEFCLKNGLNEFFRYGNMTLAQKPGDDDTLYYITDFYQFENPTPEQARLMQQTGNPGRGATGYLALVTYHLPTGCYKDNGVIQMEDGRFPNSTQSIAIDKNGRIYTCAWIPRKDALPRCCQLISFMAP